MKLKFLIIPLVLFLFVPVCFGQTTDPEPDALKSIQADFTQEKHLKILVRPIISTGTFIFQAPQSLRWEYRSPVPSILLMHGGRVKKFIEKDGRLVEDKGMGLDSMQVVLGEISNWIDGRFSDNDMFSVSFPDKSTVLLTPKEQAFAGMINKIELKLADRKGLLDEVIIFEGSDSYTKMIFKNRALNKEIPISLFTDK